MSFRRAVLTPGFRLPALISEAILRPFRQMADFDYPGDGAAAPFTARGRFLVWLDSGLLLAVAALETPRGTGLSAHEWISVVFVIAVAVHLLVNWQWIVQTLRRVLVRDATRSRLNFLLNTALFIAMTFTVFSGARISEIVLPVAGVQPSPLIPWHKVHKLFSALSVAIVGLHLGLNWNWIVAAVRVRALGRKKESASARTGGARTGTIVFADVATVCRRLIALLAVFAAVSAICLALVEPATTEKIQPARRDRFSRAPHPRSFPREFAIQLFLMGGAAALGKNLLRLRL